MKGGILTMQSYLNIVYICDEDYAFTTVISIRSLKQNRDKNLTYRVHIVTKGLSDQSIRSILELNEEQKFVISICKNTGENEVVFKKCCHVSTAALLKFALPSILDDLDYVLYVDGDILLRKGFEKIFDVNVNDVYAAVVKDMPVYEGSHLQELGLCEYFNSGIMYLNLKRMRENEIESKLLDYMKNEKINIFMDQDAFNVVMGQNVLFIHPQYNLIYDIYRKYETKQIALFYGVSENSVIDLDQSAYVLHMAGARKPWNDLESEQLDEWLSYVRDFDEYHKWSKELYSDKKSMYFLNDQMQQNVNNLNKRIDSLDDRINGFNERNKYLDHRVEALSVQNQELLQRLNSLENWVFLRIYKHFKNWIFRKKLKD